MIIDHLWRPVPQCILLIGFFLLACRPKDQLAEEISARSGIPEKILIQSGAKQIQSKKNGNWYYQVSYKLKAKYPASDLIEDIVAQIRKVGWQQLDQDVLHATSETSFTAGWMMGKSPDGQKTPLWLGEWRKNGSGTLIMILSYDNKKSEPENRTQMGVLIRYVPESSSYLKKIEELSQKECGLFVDGQKVQEIKMSKNKIVLFKGQKIYGVKLVDFITNEPEASFTNPEASIVVMDNNGHPNTFQKITVEWWDLGENGSREKSTKVNLEQEYRIEQISANEFKSIPLKASGYKISLGEIELSWVGEQRFMFPAKYEYAETNQSDVKNLKMSDYFKSK